MTSKVIEGHKKLSNFSVNPALLLLDGPLMLHPPYCGVFLSISVSLSISLSLFHFMQIYGRFRLCLGAIWDKFALYLVLN